MLSPVEDLKGQDKMEGEDEVHSFCKNTENDRGESYFEKRQIVAHSCQLTV
jgi:hypothetical protein